MDAEDRIMLAAEILSMLTNEQVDALLSWGTSITEEHGQGSITFSKIDFVFFNDRDLEFTVIVTNFGDVVMSPDGDLVISGA